MHTSLLDGSLIKQSIGDLPHHITYEGYFNIHLELLWRAMIESPSALKATVGSLPASVFRCLDDTPQKAFST